MKALRRPWGPMIEKWLKADLEKFDASIKEELLVLVLKRFKKLRLPDSLKEHFASNVPMLLCHKNDHLWAFKFLLQTTEIVVVVFQEQQSLFRLVRIFHDHRI
jgi:hypothetical protein